MLRFCMLLTRSKKRSERFEKNAIRKKNLFVTFERIAMRSYCAQAAAYLVWQNNGLLILLKLAAPEALRCNQAA